MDPNPALVQTAPSFKPGAAPLILIHDGGGTTFSYHCLKSLHRTVYAIHNPRFYSGRVWAGGITAMAKVYVEMIRSVLPLGGSLILGGWSLGGLISLEIASLLSQTADLDLLGLVMIDSICPRALNRQVQNIVPHSPFTSPHCKPEIGFLIANQLKASAKLVQDWVMPHWSSRPGPISPNPRSWTGVTAFDRFREDGFLTAGSLSSYGSASSVSSPGRDRSWGSSTTPSAFSSDDDMDDKLSPSSELPISNSNNNHGEDDNDGNPDSSSPPPPPPPLTILLRCDEYVPVSRSKNPDAISKVDIVRDRRLLGWDEYAPNLVQCVLNVPGHHFNLFAAENIEMTGTCIMEACEILDCVDLRNGYKACIPDYFGGDAADTNARIMG